MSTKSAVKEKTNLKIKIPKRYLVVMHNDDFTPMDFVVDVLMNIFQKKHEEAVSIMLQIHKGSRGVVGAYSYDIAKSKAEKAMALAREEGYPFRITVEEDQGGI